MSTAMPLVNPTTTGRGMNRTADPMPVAPSTTSMHAGHQRADEQAFDAVLRDDAGDDDDERAGRTADLQARAAEQRNQAAGDDRGVDAGLRRQARRDGEGHRQRQRDQADGDAGGEVGERGPAVVGPERGDQLGTAKRRPLRHGVSIAILLYCEHDGGPDAPLARSARYFAGAT